MKKRIAVLLLAAALLTSLCACATILEGDTLSVKPHIDNSPANQATDATEVSSYEELRSRILDMVADHRESEVFSLTAFEEGDVPARVEEICKSVALESAFSEYCIYYINSEVNQIVSRCEARITVNYRHSKAQIDSVITTYSQRYLRSLLLDALETRSGYIVFLTNMNMVTEDYISALIEELYRSNPLTVVSLPNTSVNTFSHDGSDERVIEISFEYLYTSSLLNTMSDAVNKSVDEIVDTVAEGTDALMLLSLCEKLTQYVDFDIEAAADPQLTEQDLASTAYGAFVNRSAASEGYALAYKALCDKLGLECSVVPGRFNNSTHYWNIVRIDSDYYHVDPARCDISGFETAFLKRDSDIISNYWWDTRDYPVCSGPLTYQSITNQPSGEVPDEPGDEPGEPDDEPDPEIVDGPGEEQQNGDVEG